MEMTQTPVPNGAKRRIRSPDGAGPRAKKPFAVWVTPAERVEIERLAGASGLSVSTYLRTLGLGHVPKSYWTANGLMHC